MAASDADAETDGSCEPSPSLSLSRRRFIAAGAGLVTTTACAAPAGAHSASTTEPIEGPPSPEELRHEELRDVSHVQRLIERYPDDRVVHYDDLADADTVAPQVPGPVLVEDLDDTSDEVVMTRAQDAQGRIQSAASQGQVVKLPPGDYLLNAGGISGKPGWGIVGTGEHPTDVRLHGRGSRSLVDQNGGSGFTFENFAIANSRAGPPVATGLQQGGPRKIGVGLGFTVDDGLSISKLHHIGTSPREGATDEAGANAEDFDAQKFSLKINVTDPQGVAVVDGFVKTSPTEVSGHAENDSPLASWGRHEGLVYVRNSKIHNAGGDGATYISRTAGGWRFTNCSFLNNYASTLRLASADSWVRQCTIVVDRDGDDVNLIGSHLPGNKPPMNPIVWESGGAAQATKSRRGGLVDGCEIIMHSVASSAGGITVDGSHGGVVIRDTIIENHTAQPSIAAEPATGSHMNNGQTPRGPHDIFLDGVTITGRGSGAAIDIQRPADGRNVCVENGNSVSGIPQRALTCDGGGVGTSGQAPLPGFAMELIGGRQPAPIESIGATATPVTGPIARGSGGGGVSYRRQMGILQRLVSQVGAALITIFAFIIALLVAGVLAVAIPLLFVGGLAYLLGVRFLGGD